MKRTRRPWGGLAAAVLFAFLAASPLAGEAADAPKPGGTLKFIPHADLKIIDPIWTTAYISRNHGYMIYDVLFALDENLQIQPQMVDTWEVSDDSLQYTFTLRDGLLWHDGQAGHVGGRGGVAETLGSERRPGPTAHGVH